MKAIVNGKLILKDRIVQDKVLIFDDCIRAIKDDAEGLHDMMLINAEGCYVSPGFIDIHIHGGFGYDVMDCDNKSIQEISKGLCRCGVTGFLPTTMSMDKENIIRALKNIRDYMKADAAGARVLGAHLEGPFINSLRKGAHDERYITKADYMLIKDYFDIIKLITIAPEVEGNMGFIKDMQQHRQISLSIGHSNASYEAAMKAIDEGVRSATHVFNAMSPLNHREPGVVGAVLNSDIYCELIADNIHVHPAIYKLLTKVKGSSKLVLITDAIRAACMKQGVYDLGGQEIVVRQGSARLADGTLAGSVLCLNEAVKNFWRNTDLPLHEVVSAVTINPARLLCMDDRIGSIEEGKQADLTIFDEAINIKTTIINGRLM